MKPSRLALSQWDSEFWFTLTQLPCLLGQLSHPCLLMGGGLGPLSHASQAHTPLPYPVVQAPTADCKHIGKSSLAVQFVDGHFVESYYPTIENTFSKIIKYKGQEFSTEIIDTAGQVRTTPPFLVRLNSLADNKTPFAPGRMSTAL